MDHETLRKGLGTQKSYAFQTDVQHTCLSGVIFGQSRAWAVEQLRCKWDTLVGPMIQPVCLLRLRRARLITTSKLYRFFNYLAIINLGRGFSSFCQGIAPLKYVLILVSSTAWPPLMKNAPPDNLACA